MSIKLITGYTGKAHVRAEDDASLYRGIISPSIDHKVSVLDVGENMSLDILSGNVVRILSGNAIVDGRLVRIREGDYVDLTFDPGVDSDSQTRIDSIVIRYSIDDETKVESVDLVVVRGDYGSDYPPELKDNDSEKDYLLYNVEVDKKGFGNIESKYELVGNLTNAISNRVYSSEPLGGETSLIVDGGYIYETHGDGYATVSGRIIIKQSELTNKSNRYEVDGDFTLPIVFDKVIYNVSSVSTTLLQDMGTKVNILVNNFNNDEGDSMQKMDITLWSEDGNDLSTSGTGLIEVGFRIEGMEKLDN